MSTYWNTFKSIDREFNSIVPTYRLFAEQVRLCKIPHHWDRLACEKVHLLLAARFPSAQTAIEVTTPIKRERQESGDGPGVIIGFPIRKPGLSTIDEYILADILYQIA